MPVLPDGTYVDDETYAEMIAQSSGTGLATSGYDLGTDWSYTPFGPLGTGGGTLNLGWEQAPNLSANINFDPSAGWENAFISGSDVSGEGMLDVGTVSSPNATLGLTAGVKDILGPSPANPYMNVDLNNAVSGLDLSAGTDKPSLATFSAGNLEDTGYKVDLSKFSGGPTQADFTMGLTPGVNLNLGTGQGGNIGVTASGAWDDIGKTARQLWGGVTDTLGNIISPAGADASVPDIAVAPSMSGVDYSKALSDVGIWGEVQPLSAGLDTTYIGTPYEDPLQHLDLAYRVKSQPSTSGGWLEQHTRQFAKSLPDFARLAASAYHDDPAEIDAKARQIGMSDLSAIEKQDAVKGLRQDIQDVMNNIVMEDAYQSNVPFDQMKQSIVTGVNPLIVKDYNLPGTTAPTRSNLQAMAELMSTGDASLEDSAMEMALQQDTFKELSAPTSKPSRLGPTGPTHVPAQPALPAYSGPTAAERKAQSDAQRKQAMADKKAAADAQKRFNELAAKASQQQQAQAAQAAEAQAAVDRVASANAIMAKYGGRREPAENYMSAAERNMVAAANVDTFANMGAEGPMSAAEINVAGGMEFGGAGGMAGSGRGSSGRGGPGGRGR